MHERVCRIVASTLGLATGDVDRATSMSTCPAWDSLRHFEVVLAVENEFGVRFPMDVIPELISVAELCRRLEGTSDKQAA